MNDNLPPINIDPNRAERLRSTVYLLHSQLQCIGEARTAIQSLINIKKLHGLSVWYLQLALWVLHKIYDYTNGKWLDYTMLYNRYMNYGKITRLGTKDKPENYRFT